MNGLTATLLARASRTFLDRAYPNGATIQAARSAFAGLIPDQPLEPLLVAPLCEVIKTQDGGLRGYAIRLGSAHYPNLKMQVVFQDSGATCVFGVDTHDTLRLDSNHPDHAGWCKIQSANARLKEEIERDWDAEGVLTFNGLLRRAIERR